MTKAEPEKLYMKFDSKTNFVKMEVFVLSYFAFYEHKYNVTCKP